METRSNPAEILLVEDNPGDVELIYEALQAAKALNHISLASDGEEAMAFLNRESGYEFAPRPDLILLDINIPKKDGFEVLAEVRNHPEMSRVPVVILTSSHAERDILKSYNLRANCFISKPVDVDEFLEVVRSTGEFWLSLVTLPPFQQARLDPEFPGQEPASFGLAEWRCLGAAERKLHGKDGFSKFRLSTK